MNMIHLFISFLVSLSLTACQEDQPIEAPKVPTGYLYKVEPGVPGKEVYICGQRPFNTAGNLVGPGNLGLQARQVLDNINESLKTVNMSLRNVTQVTYLVKGSSTTATAVEAVKAQSIKMLATNYFSVVPSIVEMKNVTQTVREDVLIEIEVIAVK